MYTNNVIYFPGVKPPENTSYSYGKCDRLMKDCSHHYNYGGSFLSPKVLDVDTPENSIKRFFRLYKDLAEAEVLVQQGVIDLQRLKEMQFEKLIHSSFFNALKWANISATGSAHCDFCSHVSPFHFSQYLEMPLQSLLTYILRTAEYSQFDFDDMFLSENPYLIRGQDEWVRFMYERYFDMYPEDYKGFLKSTYNETGYEDWKHIKDNECHWFEFQRFEPVITDGIVEDDGFRPVEYMIERVDLGY